MHRALAELARLQKQAAREAAEAPPPLRDPVTDPLYLEIDGVQMEVPVFWDGDLHSLRPPAPATRADSPPEARGGGHHPGAPNEPTAAGEEAVNEAEEAHSLPSVRPVASVVNPPDRPAPNEPTAAPSPCATMRVRPPG